MEQIPVKYSRHAEPDSAPTPLRGSEFLSSLLSSELLDIRSSGSSPGPEQNAGFIRLLSPGLAVVHTQTHAEDITRDGRSIGRRGADSDWGWGG